MGRLGRARLGGAGPRRATGAALAQGWAGLNRCSINLYSVSFSCYAFFMKRSTSRPTATPVLFLATLILTASTLPVGAQVMTGDIEIRRIDYPFDDINEIAEIETEVSEVNRGGVDVVRSFSDFHILTDVSLDALVETISDRDAQQEIVPRVQEYEWEPIPGSDGNAVLEEQVVGIRFMGFDATYHLRQRSELIDLRDETPRRVFLHYHMVESLDDKLASSEGVYLFQEVNREGHRYTYMRQQNITGIKDTFFGLKTILRRFTRRDTERLFEAIIAAAREREQRAAEG